LNRRPDAHSSHANQHTALRFLTWCLFAGSLICVAGCKQKLAPLTGTTIRNITREFVFAARNASHGRAEIGMRPEFAPALPGKAQSLSYDHVYITVPLTKAGAPDRITEEAIEAELGRVAEYHHMQRVERHGAPGLERFDYFWGGRRTQSIHLITPFPTVEAASPPAGRPCLAIIIDDLGNDRAQADALFRLTYPLTISVLPHEVNSAEIAEEAHRLGYQVMLHLPVASNAGTMDEPIELHPGMDAATVEKTLTSMLDTVPYASGVNNHEGSLGTADSALMDELMPLLRERNLFFIDSRTTAATVAEAAAHAAGVPAASRNVFLDDEQSAPAIRKQFELAMRVAREKKSALAIGHPHSETLQVLNEMLPEAKRQGLRLVFASDLAR
jgi:polysaccharide deacetylase 2 family uncharacterized protein YibQ